MDNGLFFDNSREYSCSTWWTSSPSPTTQCTLIPGGVRCLGGHWLCPPCSVSPSLSSTSCYAPRDHYLRSVCNFPFWQTQKQLFIFSQLVNRHLTVCVILPFFVQRWKKLTTPVWGRHHLEYFTPETEAKLLPSVDAKNTLQFESVIWTSQAPWATVGLDISIHIHHWDGKNTKDRLE